MADTPLELTEMNGLLNMEFSAVKIELKKQKERGDKDNKEAKNDYFPSFCSFMDIMKRPMKPPHCCQTPVRKTVPFIKLV